MEKKQEKTIVIFLIIVIFLFSFVVGYTFFSNTSKSYVYSGPLGNYNFTESPRGDHWLSWTGKSVISGNLYNLQSYNTPFAYGPFELEDIPLEPSTIKIRNTIKRTQNLVKEEITAVYLTREVYLDEKYADVNPKGGMVIALLTLDRLIDKFGIETLFASIEENELSNELNLPVINCEDSNESTIVIWIKEGSENKIYKDGEYCIIAEFKEGEDPTKVATKLAYNIIGVM